MPDWQKLVRQRLGGLTLDAAEKEEVHAELAAHLEETYEALLREGIPEPAAIHRVLSLASDWNDLQRKIYSARTRKDTMTNRVKQFWLPGFLTFVLSAGLLALNQILGPKPWALMKVGQPPMVLFFIPWLLSLPLVGAVGAYLCHRAGGSRRAIFSSIVFPVLPFLASILVVLPVSLVFDHFIAHNIAPMALLLALLGWVLAPGLALLAGGLPIQFFLSRRLASR
jgi:hypothetical protein